MAHQAKDLEIGFLLDFYGELLSDSRREAAELYYNEDLSLAEIAETAGITRQGVRDSIAKARVQLTGYEEKLGLAAKFRAIEHTLGEIIPELTRLRDSADGEVREALDTIIKKVGTITI
ncbi:MAG: DNA-binding protein [Clostridia bacterium]|nr:DNA-binding protein [Clostridia bacterium]MBQ2708137.1 DNA-binding protein [Clostridia bacterium]